MSFIALVYIFVTLSTASIMKQKSIPLQILNPTKINAENQQRVIVGNNVGDIHVYNKHSKLLKSYNSVHQGQILAIQRYDTSSKDEYVTVDDQGIINIWDDKLQNVKFSYNYNASVLAVAVREQKHGNQNLIAINFGSNIAVFSLTVRAELGNFSIQNENQTYISLIYLQNNLVVSDSDSNIWVLDHNRLVVHSFKSIYGSVEVLTNHQDQHDRANDGVGLAGGSYLVHFDLNAGIDQSALVGNGAIKTLDYCRTKGKRQKQDLIVIGSVSGYLQVRSMFNVHKTYQFSSGIVDVDCEEDEVVLLDGNNQLHFIELDHFQHKNGGKRSQIAGLLFLVMILAVVLYQIKRNKDKKKQQQDKQQEYSNIELKQRIIFDQQTKN